MTTLAAHILRAIDEEHRDLARELAELVSLLAPTDQTAAEAHAWAARLRGALHHLSPRLERHFQREERHFRLLAGECPSLAADFDTLRNEHDGFRAVMADLLALVLGAEDAVRAEIAARLEAFAADLRAHEQREMTVLSRLK